MTAKSEIMWCIKSAFGNNETEMFLTFTISRTRRECIQEFLRVYTMGDLSRIWPYWYRRGYRCVKVVVSEVKK